MATIFRPYNPSSGQRTDRSAGDRLRHRQKVREAIRDNIADIIAEESIIGKDNDRIIKVPIRGVKEYRFVYGENAAGVGQGGTETRSPAKWSARRKGRQRRATGRRSSGHRLLRDRRHSRRADRHHVRGSRAAGPGAQTAAPNRSRTTVPAKRLSQKRHPCPPGQEAHGPLTASNGKRRRPSAFGQRRARRTRFPFTRTICAIIIASQKCATNPTPW